MSDPKDWPTTLLGGIEPPDGILPPNWRQFGAVRWAQEFLQGVQRNVMRSTLERHYLAHLPQYPSPSQAAVDAGTMPPPPTLDVIIDYRSFYKRALTMGTGALDRLEERVAEMEAKGEPVPTSLLLAMAQIGARMAQSQAQLVVARGARFAADEDDQDDPMEGFMGEDRPSKRIGSVRIRTIEGEARPVTDEGPKDRMEYNQRAEQLGAPKLPV